MIFRGGNRPVKVTASSDTDIVIQTARFDGLGRRVRKVVTNSGDLDGTTVYYHNGNQIIETRDGSGDLVQQMYHGTQYIDELVGLRIADLGRLYVRQDANYNVVALSDMSGRFVERTYYSPYGQPEFVLDAHPFDYDDDGDVDETDIAAATTGGDCWGDYTGQDGDCKRLDADADRDIDADDHTAIVNYVNALPTDGELQRTPSSSRSMLGNAFAHQGLVLDPEIGSYQNRARQYAPIAKRFMQQQLTSNPRRQISGSLNSYLQNGSSTLESSGSSSVPSSCAGIPTPPSVGWCCSISGAADFFVFELAWQARVGHDSHENDQYNAWFHCSAGCELGSNDRLRPLCPMRPYLQAREIPIIGNRGNCMDFLNNREGFRNTDEHGDSHLQECIDRCKGDLDNGELACKGLGQIVACNPLGE